MSGTSGLTFLADGRSSRCECTLAHLEGTKGLWWRRWSFLSGFLDAAEDLEEAVDLSLSLILGGHLSDAGGLFASSDIVTFERLILMGGWRLDLGMCALEG